MHLLVLSAFRLFPRGHVAEYDQRVSMHLLVLSAFRPDTNKERMTRLRKSQCTFWCSVLSDRQSGRACVHEPWSQCTFWCSVLSDARGEEATHVLLYESQCTFWCSVLSDSHGNLTGGGAPQRVSMHLLVLSAFRPIKQMRVPLKREWVSMHLLVLSAFRLDDIRHR